MTVTTLYDHIGAGDLVGVADEERNYLRGEVRLMAGNTMAVAAFGCLIPFARRNTKRTWVPVHGIKLVEHQPPLDLM